MQKLKLVFRETSLSRHNKCPIKGPLQTLPYDGTIMCGGLKGALNQVPMMPINASLSAGDKPDRCCFSSLDVNWLQSPRPVQIHWPNDVLNRPSFDGLLAVRDTFPQVFRTICMHGGIFSETCKSKPNLDCNYNFPIDLASI